VGVRSKAVIAPRPPGLSGHAQRQKEFTPKRLVQWLQDELRVFQDGKEARFPLHDYRRTAVTGLQMAGASEKENSFLGLPQKSSGSTTSGWTG